MQLGVKCDSIQTDKRRLVKKGLLQVMTNNFDLIQGIFRQISRNCSVARNKKYDIQIAY